jgi:hypothetical protein
MPAALPLQDNHRRERTSRQEGGLHYMGFPENPRNNINNLSPLTVLIFLKNHPLMAKMG